MALIVGSEEITSALFGYGAFDEVKCFKFSKSFIFFCNWDLPAFSIIKVFSTFLFARDNTKSPFYYFFIFSFNKYYY